MEYVYEYFTFLAQVATLVVVVLLVLSAVAAQGMKRQRQSQGHLEVRKLNDHISDLKLNVQQSMLPGSEARKLRRHEHKAHRKSAKSQAKALKRGVESVGGRKRIFVLDFHGDIQASQVDHLRTEVSAVLTSARENDEVVVRLESAGGMVHGYGLAASQLDRIRRRGVPLVVAVDKVAASGGYLMAVVANRILAAPFAVVGSVGVVAQIPNVHRLLKRHDIDVEMHTAGRYKRTLSVLGENTEEGRRKFIEELEDVHRLFRDFVGTHRAELDVDAIATGETWHGQHALDMKLVDEVCTSDEYLMAASEHADVFEVHWVEHKRPIERLLSHVESSVDRVVARWLEKISQWRGGV